MEMPCRDKKYIFKVLDFVKKEEARRKREPVAVYTRGNCGNLYRHLKSVFHCARPVLYYRYGDDSNYQLQHVLTKLGDSCYDINGAHDGTVLKDSNPDDFFVNADIDSCANNYTWNKMPTGCQFPPTELALKALEGDYMTDTAARLRDYVVSEDFLK